MRGNARLLNHKLQSRRSWNQLLRESAAEEQLNRAPASFAIIKRPVVDIHADEFIRKFAAHVAGVLKRMFDGGRAMVETVTDAFVQNIRDALAQSRTEPFVDNVAASKPVRALRIPGCGNYSRKQLSDLEELARTAGAKGLAWMALESGDSMSPGPHQLERRRTTLTPLRSRPYDW